MPLRCYALLLCTALTGCQGTFWRDPAPEDAYAATIQILDAEASLHRTTDETGEPTNEFVLLTACDVKVENNSGKSQKVLSYFGTPYDDLRLRIRDVNGKRLTATSHTIWLVPMPEGVWLDLERGESVVRLEAATPVGPQDFAAYLEDEIPFIIDSELTPTIQLEFFGGFPGSDLSRAIQSNRVTVQIGDRTAEVPRKPIPLPPTSRV